MPHSPLSLAARSIVQVSKALHESYGDADSLSNSPCVADVLGLEGVNDVLGSEDVRYVEGRGRGRCQTIR